MADQKKDKQTEGEIKTTKETAVTPGQISQVLNRYTLWSLGTGLIPVPAAGLAVLAGVQLKMLKQLSLLYGVNFSENLGKSVIVALLGSVTADSMRQSLITGVLKKIPGLRYLAPLTVPVYAGAATYAVGKLFVLHFESGGTLLDFDPRKMKDYFSQLLQDGKLLASDLRNKL